MKYYILINPFNNKPMHFTEFNDTNFLVSRRVEINGVNTIEQNYAICIETNFDIDLLNKTYDPNTGNFI